MYSADAQLERGRVEARAAAAVEAAERADADGDGFVDAVEMQLYLERAGCWGSEPAYTEARWAEAFPVICGCAFRG